MRNLRNVTITEFKAFLTYKGLKHIRTSSGHEIWSGKKLLRPVIFQTHIEPIPEFIIKNNLRTIGSNKKELINFLENKL